MEYLFQFIDHANFLRLFIIIPLFVETCTVVQEVPMADCFVVDDRIWVCEADGGGCTVAVTFNIRFIKSTMFRRIIENQTRKEYESFWNQFGDMIQSLKSSLAPEEDELEEVALELGATVERQACEGLYIFVVSDGSDGAKGRVSDN